MSWDWIILSLATRLYIFAVDEFEWQVQCKHIFDFGYNSFVCVGKEHHSLQTIDSLHHGKKKVFNNQFFWLFYYYSSASNQLLQFCEIASLVQQSQALPETILSNNKHDLM